MLSKAVVIDKVEILESGHVQVRRAAYILEDDVIIAGPKYHRVAYNPGDDVSHEDIKVQTHCKAAWTPEVIAAYKLSLERL